MLSTRVMAYDFAEENTESLYWQDVGTIDSYYAANMEFLSRTPAFELYGEWPIRRAASECPPARFIRGKEAMSGAAFDSLVSDGSVVNGGIIDLSILGNSCRIGLGSSVRQSILFENVAVGSRCHLHRTIADQGVVISNHASIGLNAEEDRNRGFVVTASGITIIPALYGHSEIRKTAGLIAQNAGESIKQMLHPQPRTACGAKAPNSRRARVR